MALTDAKARTAKPAAKPYKLPDGHGLWLEVRPNGAKYWRYRYRIGGIENMFALGAYGKRGPEHGEYTLEEAREARSKARQLVKQGIHPAHARRTALMDAVERGKNTFEAVATEWMEKQGQWSAYYRKQVVRGMRQDVFPKIGTLPIERVTSAHLLDIVRGAESRGANTVALLLRQWCGAVFRYAISTLRAQSDPSQAIKGAVTRVPSRGKEPLSLKELPKFMRSLRHFGGTRPTAIALELLLLTFVRPGELRCARWSEFDIEEAIWRIPAERMKMRAVHKVPLSRQALELLKELKEMTGHQELLFPNSRKPREPMTPTTLNRALERMGYARRFSAHAFRATASTYLNESGKFRHDIIERQLAHAERNRVRAAYNKAEYLPERTEMMQHWADTVQVYSAGGKVLPVRFGAPRASA